MKKNRNDRSRKKETAAQPPVPVDSSFWRMAVIGAFVVYAWIIAAKYLSRTHLPIDVLLSALTAYFRPIIPIAPAPGSFTANLAHYATAAVVAAAVILASFGYGRLVQKLAPVLAPETELEKFFIATGLGVFVLVIILFVLGCSGWLTTVTVGCTLAAGMTGLFTPCFQKQRLKEELQLTGLPFLLKISLLVCLFSAVIVFMAALTPEVFYDSLVYHIAGANWYHITGGLKPPLSNTLHFFVSVYGKIIYAAGLFFSDETAPKFIHCLFVLLTAGAVYMAGKNLYNRTAGIFAAIAFISMPSVSVVAPRTGMEGFIMFTEFLGLYLALRYMRSGELKWLAISGLMVGTAIGFKYISIMSWASIGLILLIDAIVVKRPLKATLNAALLWNGCILAAAGPSFVFNIYYTGNPVYPAFWQHIGFLKSKDFSATTNLGIKAGIKDILMAPWEISMGGKEEAFAGVLFLIAAPLLFFTRWLKTDLKYLVIYAAVYALCWMNLCDLYFRYYLPAMPALCLLAGYALSEFNSVAVRLTLLVLVLMNTGFSSLILRSVYYPADYILGTVSRQNYLSTTWQGYPNPPYEALDWINRNLPPNAKILLQGEERSYPLRRQYVPVTIGDLNYLDTVLKASKDVDDAALRLRSDGITHLLLNIPEARRLRSFDMFHFEPREYALLMTFWQKYVKEVHRSIANIAIQQKNIYSMKDQQPGWWQQYAADEANYVYVYELLSPEEAVRPHAAPRNFFQEPSLFTEKRWETYVKAFSTRNP
jgi:hypothetical protein